MKKTVKRIRTKETEESMWIEGEFMSDWDMEHEMKFSAERREAIHTECQAHKGWVRRDRYQKEIKLYWVEKKVAGKMLNLSSMLRLYLHYRVSLIDSSFIFIYVYGIYIYAHIICIHMHACIGQLTTHLETYVFLACLRDAQEAPARGSRGGGLRRRV